MSAGNAGKGSFHHWIMGVLGLAIAAGTLYNTIQTQKLQATFLRGYEAGMKVEQDHVRDAQLLKISADIIHMGDKLDNLRTAFLREFPRAKVLNKQSLPEPSGAGLYAAEVPPEN